MDDQPPTDDGASDHLVGEQIPSGRLLASNGEIVDLSEVHSWLVVYVYPRTGVPGVAVPAGWGSIPGARGCTPQSCSYRDEHAGFRALGAAVLGLSTQGHDAQAEFARREHLPFLLLSDSDMSVGAALRLPSFDVEGASLYKRITLIARRGRIEHVRYPVFPPEEDANKVLTWLRASKDAR